MSRLLALALLLASGQALAVGTYSEGYRMGMLSKFSLKGYVVSTGEGEMLLGRESTPYSEQVTVKGKQVERVYNPWRFSADKALAPELTKLTGEYVWIRYRQELVNASFKETDYRVLEVQPVTRKAPEPRSHEAKKESGLLTRSEGVRVGRIVKASDKGKVLKTWELILQLGNAGGQFIPMSITDEALFQFAVECLKSGRPVKAYYVDKGIAAKLSLDMEDTPYRIYKLEVVEDI